MLTELHIENYALIDNLTLKFSEGLCALTGETGAGKSLIIGALKLVLGERGGMGKLRIGANEMSIWARFIPGNDETTILDEKLLRELGLTTDELILSRRITNSGRSYFWVNGKPATAETVSEIGDFLVDLHGQHTHQLLLNSSTHLAILDRFGGHQILVEEINQLFNQHVTLTRELKQFLMERDAIQKQQRLLEFELVELNRAGIDDPNEESKLENELEKLEWAERLIDFSQMITHMIIESEGNVHEIIAELRKKAEEMPIIDEVKSIRELLDSITAVCDELGITATSLEQIEFDPLRIEDIRKRLEYLGDLERKYKKDLPCLIEYRKTLEIQKLEIINYDKREEDLRMSLTKLIKELNIKAVELSRLREKAAQKLGKTVEKELAPLAMQGAVFLVDLKMKGQEDSDFMLDSKKIHLNRNGFEGCEFLFSANPGSPPMELRKIASGGELSRVALALKVALPESEGVGCAFFDEIDSGIGGRTAIKVAERLEKIAQNKQVIVITHLHPLARRAGSQILIEKEMTTKKTTISARMLTSEERIKEFERMMSIE